MDTPEAKISHPNQIEEEKQSYADVRAVQDKEIQKGSHKDHDENEGLCRICLDTPV